MIRYIHKGNIFNSEAVALVNPVNCLGVSGAGLAKEFAWRYPMAQRAYEHAAKRGQFRPGKVMAVREGDQDKIIVHVPTKDDWRDPSELIYVAQGLDALRGLMTNRHAKVDTSSKYPSIAIPALGCGHGGLPWERVKHLIEGFLGDIDADIFIYCPPGT